MKRQAAFPRWCEGFRQGKCNKGNACPFRHCTDAEVREMLHNQKEWNKTKDAKAAAAAEPKAKAKGKAKAKAKARST